jgi:tRNA_anti-like
MIKKIVLVLVVFALLGSYIGYKMYNKPHTNVVTAHIETSISADDLLKAFKENEAQAGNKFINKVIEVSGNIADSKNENNQIIIQIETTDMLSNVICTLDSTQTSNKKEYKVGQSIRIKGICSGYLSDVILDRCVVSN